MALLESYPLNPELCGFPKPRWRGLLKASYPRSNIYDITDYPLIRWRWQSSPPRKAVPGWGAQEGRVQTVALYSEGPGIVQTVKRECVHGLLYLGHTESVP